MEIFGDEGAIYLSGRSKNYGPQKVKFVKRWFWKQNTQDKVWEYSDKDNSFLNELKDFYNVIVGSKSNTIATPQDGYRAIEIIDKLYQSPNKLIQL